MLNRRTLIASAAAAATLPGCGIATREMRQLADAATHRGGFGRAGRLTKDEQQWARTAWRYVENNTDYERGLVGGFDRRALFTVSDAADALAACVAAHELEVIPARDFDVRTSRILGFLASMDLSDGRMPNKAYSTRTGKMAGFDGREADIGWSALDAGRLLLWLKITGQRHAFLREYCDKVMLRWNYCDAIDGCGRLFGTARDAGVLHRYQEGRLGDEQLAAAGYAAWGFDTRESGGLPPTAQVNIHGVRIDYDARDPRATGVAAPVTTMPYANMGLELGWNPPGGNARADWRALAQQVFTAQRERWLRDGELTARAAYQIAEAPYNVLASVYASGYAWNTIGYDNKEYEKLALVSTRAAFAMWALWPGDYADALIAGVRNLYDPDRGWYEGRLELGGGPSPAITLATNAAVLKTLLFKATGVLYAPDTPRGYFDAQMADRYVRHDRCLPSERRTCEARPA